MSSSSSTGDFANASLTAATCIAGTGQMAAGAAGRPQTVCRSSTPCLVRVDDPERVCHHSEATHAGLVYARRVAGLHPWLGAVAIASARLRPRRRTTATGVAAGRGTITTHLLSLAQTLLVAQVGSGSCSSPTTGAPATSCTTRMARWRIGVALVPWFYAPAERARGACSGSRARPASRRARIRAYMTGRRMRRLFENRFLRGMVFIALSRSGSCCSRSRSRLVTASALITIAFFLAIAFFLFLLWRERRSTSRRGGTSRDAPSTGRSSWPSSRSAWPLGRRERPRVRGVRRGDRCVRLAIVRVWKREHRYV